MIYGGLSRYAEVIDLLDNTTQCDLFATLSIEAAFKGSFGGRIGNDFVYCSGWGPYYYIKRCFKVGADNYLFNGYDEPKIPPDFAKDRAEITTFSLPNNTLFVTGKIIA